MRATIIRLFAAFTAFGLLAAYAQAQSQTVGLNDASGTPDANAAVAECDGVGWPAEYVPARSTVTLPSDQLNVSERVQYPVNELPALDTAALLAEDRANAAPDRPVRAGIPRALEGPLAGQWYDMPDGRRLWTCAVVADGAEEVRVHFAGFKLPANGEVYVFAPDEPDLAGGPYTSSGPLASGEFWSASAGGDTAFIEYLAPADAGETPPFTIDQIAHIYRSETSSGGLRGWEDCMESVACYPDWIDISHAVAKLTFQSFDDVSCPGCFYNCSGTLLASENGDLTPYFLTANHCVNDVVEADSLELQWFYQLDTCTSGFGAFAYSYEASVLSTGPQSVGDYSLLMVDGTLPPGVYWSGWTDQVPANGSWAVTVHHPGGKQKRYSRGKRYAYSTSFDRITFDEPGSVGTIYFGSSGSGIWRESDMKLFGDASFVTSSNAGCDFLSTDAGYGRFSRYYPTIAGYLTAGSDDAFEDNDSCASAATVSNGVYNGLVVKSLDDDWYEIPLIYGEQFDVTLTFTDAHGNIDMELLEGCGGSVVAASQSTTNDESISYLNEGPPATYYLHVYLVDDTRATYTMNLGHNLTDCNGNGTADQCDLSCGDPGSLCDGMPNCGLSYDCNNNAVPDECETDCNGDGLADECALLGQSGGFTKCPGEEATFTVTASDPGYTYQWVGPSGPLTDDGRITGATTDTLTISDLQPTDAGDYSCEIRDGCVLVESAPASLEVRVLADITTQPAPLMYVCLNSTALLTIGITGGSPGQTFQWYRDGMPVSNSAKYTGATTTDLRMFNTGYEDQDVAFTCVVSDGCSSVESNPAYVRVASPVITQQPEDACGVVGETVTLTASATSDLPITYQWRIGTTVVGSGPALVLDNLLASDAGDYRVLAFTTSPVCISYSDYATVAVPTSPACWNGAPGDMDGDGDYDLRDMQQFTMCFGADVTGDYCCGCADVDDLDDAVTLDDWAALESQLTGPQ